MGNLSTIIYHNAMSSSLELNETVLGDDIGSRMHQLVALAQEQEADHIITQAYPTMLSTFRARPHLFDLLLVCPHKAAGRMLTLLRMCKNLDPHESTDVNLWSMIQRLAEVAPPATPMPARVVFTLCWIALVWQSSNTSSVPVRRVLQCLVGKGSLEPNSPLDEKRNTCAHMLAHSDDCIDALIPFGLDLAQCNVNGSTYWHTLVLHNAQERLETLVSRGCTNFDLVSAGVGKDTFLQLAERQGIDNAKNRTRFLCRGMHNFWCETILPATHATVLSTTVGGIRELADLVVDYLSPPQPHTVDPVPFTTL
jgi:hypothetical protein